MDLYLAESGNIFKQAYEAHAAAGGPNAFLGTNILQSFWYCNTFTEEVIIPHCKNFMLDSGAFTFMQNAGKSVPWLDYLDRYIQFINKNRVQLFFELDIDSVVGHDKVLELRKRLEAGTGKKCIPVWHKSRGKDEFLRLCEQYDYVAIGGIVTREITSKEYKYFPWFINEAHKRGAKVHGLGFTNLEGLRKYHFDSVDSTAWVSGNRFGHVYQFDGKTMVKYDKQPGKRLKDYRAVGYHNFKEWVKFQQYATLNL